MPTTKDIIESLKGFHLLRRVPKRVYRRGNRIHVCIEWGQWKEEPRYPHLRNIPPGMERVYSRLLPKDKTELLPRSRETAMREFTTFLQDQGWYSEGNCTVAMEADRGTIEFVITIAHLGETRDREDDDEPSC